MSPQLLWVLCLIRKKHVAVLFVMWRKHFCTRKSTHFHRVSSKISVWKSVKWNVYLSVSMVYLPTDFMCFNQSTQQIVERNIFVSIDKWELPSWVRFLDFVTHKLNQELFAMWQLLPFLRFRLALQQLLHCKCCNLFVSVRTWMLNGLLVHWHCFTFKNNIYNFPMYTYISYTWCLFSS